MKEKLRNKKVIAGIVAVIAVITIIVVVVMMNQGSLNLKAKELTVEYGQQVPLDPKEYLDEKVDAKVISSTTVALKDNPANVAEKDYLPVGEYTLILTYEKETEEVKVIVKDTTAPEFKDFKDVQETVKDVKLDYTKQYVAEDLSEVTITCDETNVKYETVGEYKATVKATDTSKNLTEKEITVKVTEPTTTLKKDSLTLYVKETSVLDVEVKGKDKATFKSNDDGVASVDENGKVTAKKTGTATITASANGKDATCKVTVKAIPSGSTTTKKTVTNPTTGKKEEVTVVQPSKPSGGSTQSGTAKISMEAFNLINNERATLGLNKLKYASSLETIALARAKELTVDFSHDGMNKYDPNYRLGEVCAKLGSNNTASHAVNGWMNSSGHKNILMDPDAKYLIIAYCSNCWEGITKF